MDQLIAIESSNQNSSVRPSIGAASSRHLWTIPHIIAVAAVVAVVVAI